MLVSEYNALGDGRYYDIDTQSSFDFDHATVRMASDDGDEGTGKTPCEERG